MKTRRVTVGHYIDSTKAKQKMNDSDKRDSERVSAEKAGENVEENDEEEMESKIQLEEAGDDEIEVKQFFSECNVFPFFSPL